MIRVSYKFSITLLFLVVFIWSCKKEITGQDATTHDQEIRQIHKDYVNGWLEMDEEKVMGLLEANARIQPNRLKPIEGKAAIRAFWFPKDSSVTTIHDYKTEIISLNIMDTLAVSTHTSLLDWTYHKDSLSFGMIQKGISTTIYRKQTDNSWKIWRSMWSDIVAENK